MGFKPVSRTSPRHEEIVVGLDVDVLELSRRLDANSSSHVSLAVVETESQMLSVAAAVAAQPREMITSLVVSEQGFDPSCSALSTAALSTAEAAQFFLALPHLRHLELHCHSLLRLIAHPCLESLTLRGFPIIDSLFSEAADLPRLVKLCWETSTDSHGVSLFPSALAALFDAKGLPALEALDLGEASLDGNVLETNEFLNGALLGQLRQLRLRTLEEDVLAEVKDKLKHLSVHFGPARKREHRRATEKTSAPGTPRSPFCFMYHLDAFSLKGLVNSTDVRGLVGALRNTHCEAIHLRGYELSPGSVVKLAHAFARVEGLSRIAFTRPLNVGLKAKHLRALATSLGEMSTLRSLSLSQNEIQQDGWQYVLELVGQHKISDLDISRPGHAPEDHMFDELVDGLSRATDLRNLNVRGIEDSGQGWASALRKCPHLKSVRLGFSDSATNDRVIDSLAEVQSEIELQRLSVDGVKNAAPLARLAQAIAKQTRLYDLALDNVNLVGELGTQTIDHLVGESNLTSLALTGNSVWGNSKGTVDAASAMAFAKALRHSSLKKLALKYVEFPRIEVMSFVRALPSSSIAELSGLPGGIEKEDEAEVIKQLGSVDSLRHLSDMPPRLGVQLIEAVIGLESLDIGRMYTRFAGFDRLFDAAREHPALQILDVSRHELDDSAEKSLARLIGESKNLRKLIIRWCMISLSGWKAICAALEKSRSLEVLVASDGDRLPPAIVRMLVTKAKDHPTLRELY